MRNLDDLVFPILAIGLVIAFTVTALTGCVTVRPFPSQESQLDTAQRAYEAGCVEALTETALRTTPPIVLTQETIREVCGMAAVRYRETLSK